MSDIVFNDLCLTHSSITTAAEAKSAFEVFLAEISAAIDDGSVRSVVRSQIPLLDAKISLVGGGDWSVDEWYSSPGVDADARRLILTLDTKVPVEADYPLSTEDEEALLQHDYNVNGLPHVSCFVFGFALHTESVLASIATDPLWKNHELVGNVLLNGQVVRSALVLHLSEPDHADVIGKLLRGRALPVINGRDDFVAQKQILFNHLKFSPDVDDQAQLLTARQIDNLLAKLSKMDQTAQRWQERKTQLPEYLFPWRGESTSTMQRKELKDARVFRLPDGGDGVFEHHLDFSASHRIHFIEDAMNKTFIIGYVGDHLPTVRFPH